MSLLRLTGSGGENCQCSIATPGVVAQKAAGATRKSPLAAGLLSAPDAKAMVPGSTITPLKVHGAGPLHISFCNTASNTELSTVKVSVIVPQPPDSTSTFCSMESGKVR